MSYRLSALIGGLIELCCMSITNATSLEVIISPEGQKNYSVWFGALAAFLGAIFGSVISGIFLIKKVREEKRLEFFSDVYEKFYVPFEDIAYPIISEGKISMKSKQDIQEFYRKNKKWIFLSPNNVRWGMKTLLNSIESKESDQAIINNLMIILDEIDKISDDMSYKG